MEVPVPEACKKCWPDKLKAARNHGTVTLCPLLARAAMKESEVPGGYDAVVDNQARSCGGRVISQVLLPGARKDLALKTIAQNLGS